MAEKHAFIKQLKGITFVGKADSNHWITIDGSKEFGGSNSAAGPKELLLLSLASCTGSDIVSILKKKRISLEGFEMNVTADAAEEHPKVYKNIHIEFLFYGKNIPAKDIERAIELSQTKYCAVTRMLEKAVNISHSYKIILHADAVKES